MSNAVSFSQNGVCSHHVPEVGMMIFEFEDSPDPQRPDEGLRRRWRRG